jgi:serine/threonine protein kinase
MGAVFLIRRQSTGEEAACKVMLPGVAVSERLRGKFLREIGVAKAFHHPHLVTLLHSGAWQNIFWYTMPFYPGGNVAQLVRRRGGKMPPAEACPIILQVLDGLECLHQASLPAAEVEDSPWSEEKGVVHRDIKPENILLDGALGSYTARLGDYGLAKFRALAGRSGLTASGDISGTWSSMCRQQLGDFKYAGPEVDVWATAACLYFMVTGYFPRDIPAGERRPWKTIEQNKPKSVRERGIPIPGEITAELADLLDKALDDTAQLRFQSAKEFKTALLRVQAT